MNGLELIAAERKRQIEAEGWTPEHDDKHDAGQLAAAGGCYALYYWSRTDSERLWPWTEDASYKPSDDRIRNLVKAGALIAAEIDRLQRESQNAPSELPHTTAQSKAD